MRIYIYGTGRYATNFLDNCPELENTVSGFIESKKSKNLFRGKLVYTPSEIQEYDLILVASQFIYEIKENLYRRGFNLAKVVFLTQAWIPANISDDGIKYNFKKASKEPIESAVFFELSSVYTTSCKIAEKLKGDIRPESFWQEIQQYQTNINASHISLQQRDILDNLFIPKLNKKDNVCDVGCASGEWSRYISPYVNSVSGFDISKNMINTAKNLSIEYGYDNIDFTCINAINIELGSIYNHALVLGVGIYLQEDALHTLIKNISKCIKKGGYVAVRDTMTMYTDKTVYMVRKEQGNLFEKYTATYIPLRLYEKIYRENGFKIVEERYFCSYFHEPVELGAHGYIFEKV